MTTQVQEKYKAGETEFKNLLGEYFINYVDVSDNPKYWKRDIDIFVQDEYEGYYHPVEIKWDSWIGRTRNLFIEFYCTSTVTKDNRGWYKYTEAEYLAYGDSQNKCFYLIWMKDFRKYVEENKHRFQQRSTYTNPYYKTGTSTGYLVNVDEYAKKHPIVKVSLEG